MNRYKYNAWLYQTLALYKWNTASYDIDISNKLMALNSEGDAHETVHIQLSHKGIFWRQCL